MPLRTAILSGTRSSLFYCESTVPSISGSLYQVHTPSFTAMIIDEVTTCHSIHDHTMEDHACICANTSRVFGQFSQVECKATMVGRDNAIVQKLDVAHPLTKTFRVACSNIITVTHPSSIWIKCNRSPSANKNS